MGSGFNFLLSIIIHSYNTIFKSQQILDSIDSIFRIFEKLRDDLQDVRISRVLGIWIFGLERKEEAAKFARRIVENPPINIKQKRKQLDQRERNCSKKSSYNIKILCEATNFSLLFPPPIAIQPAPYPGGLIGFNSVSNRPDIRSRLGEESRQKKAAKRFR